MTDQNLNKSKKMLKGLQKYKDGDAVDPRNQMDAFCQAWERSKGYIKQFDWAVDVGCGNGRHTNLLADEFRFVIAIDIGEKPEIKDNVVFFKINGNSLKGRYGFALYWGSYYLIQDIVDADIVLVADERCRNLDIAEGHRDGMNYSVKELNWNIVDQFTINNYLEIYVIDNTIR